MGFKVTYLFHVCSETFPHACHQLFLAQHVRGGYAIGRTIVICAVCTDDSIDPVTVITRILIPFEHNGTDPLAPDRTVGTGIKGMYLTVRGFKDHNSVFCERKQINRRSADHAGFRLSSAQALAGLADCQKA